MARETVHLYLYVTTRLENSLILSTTALIMGGREGREEETGRERGEEGRRLRVRGERKKDRQRGRRRKRGKMG